MLIQDYIKNLKSNSIMKMVIPMEMRMGWPIILKRNGVWCIHLPFYFAELINILIETIL